MPGGAVVKDLEVISPDEVRDVLFRAGIRDEEQTAQACPDGRAPSGGRGGFATVLMVGLFSALGGGLFGLDIGYISGVITMASFSDDLLQGQQLAAMYAGAITGVFALGAVLAAFPPVISAVVNRLGRTGAIALGSGFFCLGAVLQCLAPNIELMFVGRFVAGAAVGLLSANIPIFQGEIAPPRARGAIVALYQLAITVGIMVAFWTNYALQGTEHGWRWSIGLQLGPGLLLIVGAVFMPGSPRWLVQKGREEDALATLRRIRGPADDVLVELALICREQERELAEKPSVREFITGLNGRLLVIGVVLQLLQQMCGLNAFMYYGPRIFERAFASGSGAVDTAFLFSAVTGVVNFISTFPAILLVDRVGRMTLLRWSAAGMCICCAVLASVGPHCFPTDAMASAHAEPICGRWAPWTIAAAIFLFIFSFAFGWGPVVWVYCAEIYPTRYRTMSNGLATDANWVGNFLIGFLPPLMLEKMGFQTFWVFGAVNLLGLLMACRLPETKGRNLEELHALFEGWLRLQPAGQAPEHAESVRDLPLTPENAADTIVCLDKSPATRDRDGLPRVAESARVVGCGNVPQEMV